MRNTVIDRLTGLAKNNKKIFIVTGDAGFGVLDEFKKNYSERFLNLGVAEQNAAGFSAGLALAGYKVFLYNIIPFVLYRCYEQVRNDICYQNLSVTLVGIGSGVTYAPQGVTHYSVEDVALARTLPNITILSPSDRFEAVRCADYAIRCRGPVYIRLAKSGEPAIHKAGPIDVTKPIVINKGNGVAVLFHGSVGIEVAKAVEGMNNKPLILSVPMIQPLDVKFLKGMLKNVHTIITVEEHFVEGGLGSVIAEKLCCDFPGSFRLVKLGIRNEFIHAIKNNAGMRDHYGISARKIRMYIEKARKDA